MQVGRRITPQTTPWGIPLRWIAFFGVILAAWATLFAMSVQFAERAPVSLLGLGMGWLAPLYPDSPGAGLLPDVLAAICFAGAASGEAAPLALFAMWALMVLAMMAPTAAPLAHTYGGLAAANPARVSRFGFWALLAGFCAVWIGFAAIAAAAQAALSWAGAMTFGGVLDATWLAAALLAVAGLYQFSSLKAACLSRCRAPLTYFLAHWRHGAAGALRMGLHHGLACLGCCWALMALGFVGGTMNLLWMGIAMALMTLEKLPRIGRTITAPLGVVILAGAAIVAWQAATA